MFGISKIVQLTSFYIKTYIDWLICFLLIPWAFESYTYFFMYEEIFYPNALYFQSYSEFNWITFLFLLGYYKEMRSLGKVTLIGIFFILAINTYQLHFKFEDSFYIVIYLSFVFVFIFIAYLSILFRYIERLFTKEEY